MRVGVYAIAQLLAAGEPMSTSRWERSPQRSYAVGAVRAARRSATSDRRSSDQVDSLPLCEASSFIFAPHILL